MSLLHKVKEKLRDRKVTKTKRSGKWPTIRKQHLENNPYCAVCGSDKKVEVHHKKPFYLDPSKELDPDNLISLCESKKWIKCHLCVGHLGSYKNENSNVEEDAKYINEMLKNENS